MPAAGRFKGGGFEPNNISYGRETSCSMLGCSVEVQEYLKMLLPISLSLNKAMKLIHFIHSTRPVIYLVTPNASHNSQSILD